MEIQKLVMMFTETYINIILNKKECLDYVQIFNKKALEVM